MAADHGEPHDARRVREREGEGARLGVQLSGGGRVSVGGLQKRLEHMGAWPGNAWSWVCLRPRARAVQGGQFRQAGPTEQREQ
jgi:hypothetical protein